MHSTRFLDILMEKLDHLVDKTPKTKDFAQHQEDKKKTLMDFIKLRFLPSTYAIQKALASELEVPELKLLSHICFSLVKMNSLHGMTNPPEVAFYRDLFIIFKVREERGASKGEVERKVTSFIDREIEKYQKKVNLRTSLMTIKDEKEESSNSVE